MREAAAALLRVNGPAYYRHADKNMVRRIGGVAFGVMTLVAVGVLPVAPPTAHGAAAGWVLALATLAAGAAIAAVLLRGSERVSVRVTLALAMAGMAEIALIDWLAGAGAPYDRLYMLIIIWVAATHTVRRVLGVVAFAALLRLPILAEQHWATAETAEVVVQATVWMSLAGLAVLWTAGVRAQRAAAERDEIRARQLARVDALTGLGNRRAFDEAATAEVARTERSDRPLSLLVADLDAFKAINDTHGHLAGDDVLRQVAAVLRATVRRPDACFRWGGDEFAVLLADTDLAGAEVIGERFAEAVADTCRAPGGRRITLGLGIAEQATGDTPETLLARADEALLAAKAQAA